MTKICLYIHRNKGTSMLVYGNSTRTSGLENNINHSLVKVISSILGQYINTTLTSLRTLSAVGRKV
jgi:hypothetical protein